MSFEVITFGCRLNIYESEIIRKNAEKAGIKSAVIFNSCAVTQEAEKKLQKSIRKVKKDNPGVKIILTGCAAQISGKKYIKDVDHVFGNQEKLEVETYQNLEKFKVSNILDADKPIHSSIDVIQKKTRAFLQIQNGCNHDCTFCIIPSARGVNRSVPLEHLVKYAEDFARNNYKEIVLTGVDITDYGLDINGERMLSKLLKKIITDVPGIERIRLSSVDVAEIDDTLIELLTQERKIMPHIHLSMQSGDNMVLKRMKRRHNRDQIINFCKKIIKLRPQTVFGADIIAGFPTETEEMFRNTYDLVKEIGMMHLHVFPYSKRQGTPAARMPQVHSASIHYRAKKLRLLSQDILEKHLKEKVGNNERVMVEANGYGTTEDYCKVKMQSNLKKGDIINLKILNTENSLLIA